MIAKHTQNRICLLMLAGMMRSATTN